MQTRIGYFEMRTTKLPRDSETLAWIRNFAAAFHKYRSEKEPPCLPPRTSGCWVGRDAEIAILRDVAITSFVIGRIPQERGFINAFPHSSQLSSMLPANCYDFSYV
jgi:hypothetical protein